VVSTARGLCFCILLFLAAGLYAQSPPPPDAWVLLEQAQTLIADDSRMGEALDLLRRAIEAAGNFPEAEMAVAEIYFREGALALAEERLRKALDHRESLRVPEDRFAILYRLAEIYEIQKRYYEMEKALLAITGEQQEFAETVEAQRFRNAFLAAYLSRGLDHLLRLYRQEDASFALRAHAKLGWFYYRTGRFDPGSILHSLAALDIIITEGVREIRQVDPTFEFKNLGDFVEVALKRENLRSFLAESGFFSIAYYLGTADHPAGYLTRAREIWKLLAGLRLEPQLLGSFGELSRRQLKKPWVDPYINPSSRQIEYPDN
jgi:tetratricopeptide (TPR) repeat protein